MSDAHDDDMTAGFYLYSHEPVVDMTPELWDEPEVWFSYVVLPQE